MSRSKHSPLQRQAPGYVMGVMVVIMVALVGVASLAVDYGHVQLVKTQLHRAADATAHDYILLYNLDGKTYANANAPSAYSSTINPVYTGTGPPTYTVTWGYWNATTATFSTTAGTGPVAVQVAASCTAANGNGVPLLFGSIVGQRTCNVNVTAVAAVSGSNTVSTSVNVLATANPYFAGMPAGTTNAYGDTTSANGAISVTGIPVSPGTYMTFTGFTGTTSVVPGTVPYVGPSGQVLGPAAAIEHGQDYDGTEMSPGPENGIGDAIMPDDALMGVFLGPNAPDTNPAPAEVDWTQPAQANQSIYSNIQLQQPFMIGNGLNGLTTKQFEVPPGATQLFIGVWDGVQYNNNGGSLTGTITVQPSVTIVQ